MSSSLFNVMLVIISIFLFLLCRKKPNRFQLVFFEILEEKVFHQVRFLAEFFTFD